MKLLLIRHGETDWTISGQLTGTTEIPLTAHGRSQAVSLRQLVNRALGTQRVLVYSSPRERAVETAKLVLPLERPVVDSLLAEFDYGVYEGMTPSDVRAGRPEWDIWRDGCPGGESVSAAVSRADRFLSERAEPDEESLVVAVTHGHFSRILAARALGLPGAQGRLFASATASASIVEDHHGERCISLWNASADLVYGGAPEPLA
jgi:probable phosphoglycerate mutase